MADINSQTIDARLGAGKTERGAAAIDIIEHLFFAYRDFVGEPDAVLADLGFGRAHHRVLHFVHRNPGMTVAVLLEILQITKQSLARVLKNLIEEGYIEQHAGADDRRQRLLYTTANGAALAEKLIAIQSSRIERALAGLPAPQHAMVQTFLSGLRNDPNAPTSGFAKQAEDR
ncbi:MAG: MarR family transcriptional regulator [Devosiaceae bacterium]|nr:MarR family transcriptional regulator [Devosiaceae bacterium MH13]